MTSLQRILNKIVARDCLLIYYINKILYSKLFKKKQTAVEQLIIRGKKIYKVQKYTYL